MKIRLTALALIIFASAFSQFRDPGPEKDPRIKLLSDPKASFIDLSRLSVSHSFSTGYFSSDSNSMLINEYIAGIKYKISEPLTLRMDIGMSYMPYSTFSAHNEEQSELYLRSASLDYQPGESFRMRIDFNSVGMSDHLFRSDLFKNNYFNGNE
ncbi:MAG: hypothetical protein R6V47_00700 [Candidatus Delongbacteria bacterium]